MSVRHRGTLIYNGRLVDPSSGYDGIADIAIRDGRIVAIGSGLSRGGFRTIDASDLVVAPGFIDFHVHLRQPGFDNKETISTGTEAAAAGGFTSLCCMPNTDPALDSVQVLQWLEQKTRQDGVVKVYPIASISKGRMGLQPVDYDALVEAGAVGFSDDGDTCDDSAIMVQALEASRRLDRPVMVHCEEKSLAGGSMNDGPVASRLGLRGLPAIAEEICLARELALAAATEGWLHALHVSTGKGANLIRKAKAAGVNVTAEVMPHHLLMTDDWVAGERRFQNVNEPAGPAGAVTDPHTKVNPPLRTAEDTRLLLAALNDGAFDIVATDHAPHQKEEKVSGQFERAAFGMSGLEVALPLMLALVRAGHLSLLDLVRLMSWRPAQLLRSAAGVLKPGAPADLVMFDPAERWTVETSKLKTMSANTPTIGLELQGRVKLTIVDGETRFAA